MKRLALQLTLWLLLLLPALGREVIPAKPARYFNDYAGIVSAAEANRLNAQLEQFERDSSNQIVVAIYPKMESDSTIEDYTVRVAQKWGVGQKGKNNGAVLFVFVNDHKLYLQVFYGLEGAIPDALANRIIANEIVPSFKAGDYFAGLQKGVNAILAASKGEYKGTDRTVRDNQDIERSKTIAILTLFIFIVLIFIAARIQGGTAFTNTGRRRYYGGNSYWGSGGGWSSGGSSGGGWSGGGGGFSSGGGSCGGGGAGGSW